MMVCMDVYLRYTRSCHDMESQLVPFAAPPSVLGTLPLFSSSSRREANKRWVRSAFGCKCSISVTQDDRASENEARKVGKKHAYLFAARNEPLHQHRLCLLCIIQLLPNLLILKRRAGV